MQTWVFTKATCLKNVSPLLQSGFTLVGIKGPVEFSIACSGDVLAQLLLLLSRLWESLEKSGAQCFLSKLKASSIVQRKKLMWNDYIRCLL